MANFCLLRNKVQAFVQGLKSGEIDPVKLSDMTSAERHSFLEKYVGKDQAANVNAEFESKLLLKNQEQGMITWAKQVTGITPKVRMDIIAKIERLGAVLEPADKDMFLSDLVERRLGVGVTDEEASNIAKMSQDITTSKDTWQTKVDENKTWSENPARTRKEWIKDDDRLNYGLNQVHLKSYMDDLKLSAKKIGWNQPFRKILNMPVNALGTMKAVIASMDDSFFGRQGIKTLLTGLNNKGNYAIWGKNFLKSFKDLGEQIVAKGNVLKSGDDAVMDMVKADILSRPNALNGKYTAGGYGLDVLSEEAFPSSFPEKIPLFGRVYKASEVAYNAGALRFRADLADNLIARAENAGVNTLNREEAQGIGHLVSSITGRGNLKLTAEQAKSTNVLLFAPKFLKGNVDDLTAHIFDKAVRQNPFARKEAAKNLASIVTTLAGAYTVANVLNPGSVELDPHNTNFGKIKIWGHYVDPTGGMSSLVVLASRLTPTVHDGKWGFWTQSSNGAWTDLAAGKYGQQNGFDVLTQFMAGKAAPGASVLIQLWKGQQYNGQPVTPGSIAANTLPMPMQNWQQFTSDPNSSFALGSQILDGLGFSVTQSVESNAKSGYIPENKKMSNGNLVDAISIYANALGTDPETAFNRIFTGQQITRVTNGTVVVKRMSLAASTAVKKAGKGNNPSMKLDHTVPLELGGSNDTSNLKLVTTSEWKSYTPVENALGKALIAGKISKNEAQSLITRFKNKQVTAKSILEKYK